MSDLSATLPTPHAGLPSHEITMRRSASFVALLATLACHHATRPAEQALGPESPEEPLAACVHTALASAPNVAEVLVKRDKPRTQNVRFVSQPGAMGMALVVAPSRGTPSQLVAEYTLWIGTPKDPGLLQYSATAAADAAVHLLEIARSACAPSARGEPSCSLMPAFGQEGQKTQAGRCSIKI